MENPFKKLFELKKLIGVNFDQGSLGVDIGSSSIKIVQLGREKERAILQTYGEIALGPYGKMEVGNAVKISDDKVAEALRDVLKESNAKIKRATVSIPLKSSFVTVMEIPAIADKKLPDVIQLEARRYIPVPITEVVTDWWVFPEEQLEGEGQTRDGQKIMRVMLVAIHKNEISKYQSIISKAGLDLETFELEAFSMLRACMFRETAPVAVIDIGAATTKAAISDFGIMKSAHSIGKGSQDLTMAISNSMGVDFRRAEEIKREIGLSDLPENKEIIGVMEPILDFIFSEVNSVIRDYQMRYRQAVRRTIICGGGSLLKGVLDMAVKRLNMEVSVADPFSKAEYPAFLEKVLKEAGPNFAIAAGLALRHLQSEY